MAESISEGTLKQFSKSVGDYVERDEEIATIETDKIDVSVNAPEAGTIKEFLANEEDTVTVGQELVRMETGGSPGESKATSATSEPKDAASSDQSTSSQPSGNTEKSDSGSSKSASNEASTEKEAPKKEEPPKASKSEPTLSPDSEPKQPAKKPDIPKPAAPKAKEPEPKVTEGGMGGRGEHRVRNASYFGSVFSCLLTSGTGQDEQNEASDCRTSQAVPKYGRVLDNVQQSRYVSTYGDAKTVQG